jgi:hypothetical protein
MRVMRPHTGHSTSQKLQILIEVSLGPLRHLLQRQLLQIILDLSLGLTDVVGADSGLLAVLLLEFDLLDVGVLGGFQVELLLLGFFAVFGAVP